MIRINLNHLTPNQIGPVDLNGVTYRVGAHWSDRLAGWYVDLYLADGTAIVEGVRVADGGLVVRDVSRHDVDAPGGGVIVALGKERYAREDFGVDGGINLYYLTQTEWDTLYVATPEDVRITP